MVTAAGMMRSISPHVRATAWTRLRPFTDTIDGSDQVMLIASTGGAKSTLAATLTLDVDSLIAIDEKGALLLPRARLVELPERRPLETAELGSYYRRVKQTIEWQDTREHRGTNRIVLRPHVLDIENFDAHDDIFHAIYERRTTITWLDEITATGASAQRVQPWLRAISARGRTRGLGLWTCTQAPYGVTPPILRRNATYTIVGPLDPDDVAQIPRPGIEIAETIPRKSGRFMVYRAGEREPYRLYMPIPDRLKGWRAS